MKKDSSPLWQIAECE